MHHTIHFAHACIIIPLQYVFAIDNLDLPGCYSFAVDCWDGGGAWGNYILILALSSRKNTSSSWATKIGSDLATIKSLLEAEEQSAGTRSATDTLARCKSS